VRKLLNKPWFVATLAAAALLLAARSLLFQHAPEAGADGGVAPTDVAAAAPDSAAPIAAAAQPAPSIEVALNALAISRAPRDPFAVPAGPAIVAGIPVADFIDRAHLSAVWTQNGATLVLINDVIHQAGDVIGRLTIESATQEGVWITHWKGRDFLPLGGTFTLNTPAGRAAHPSL
jgi:hypothetical protein